MAPTSTVNIGCDSDKNAVLSLFHASYFSIGAAEESCRATFTGVKKKSSRWFALIKDADGRATGVVFYEGYRTVDKRLSAIKVTAVALSARLDTRLISTAVVHLTRVVFTTLRRNSQNRCWLIWDVWNKLTALHNVLQAAEWVRAANSSDDTTRWILFAPHPHPEEEAAS